MFTALDKYVLREITVPFGVGFGLFFVVVSFGQVIKVSDSVTGLGITIAEVGQALVYSFPPLLGLLIPVSTLFSTLLGVGRLASDREVIGLCAAGTSPYSLLRVPVVLGLILALFSGVTMAFGEPWGIRGLRGLMSRGAQQALATGARSGEFHEWVPGVTLYAGDERNGIMRNVLFADLRDVDVPIVISAKTGIIRPGDAAKDLIFELNDGTILMSERATDDHRVFHFETSHYLLDVGGLVGNKARTLSPVQEKDIPTLQQEMRTTDDPAYRALLTVTLHRKFAIPLATFVFSILAVPLACRSTPGARARGFLFSTAIVGAYYYIGRAAELSARNGGFPPFLAAWVPNLIGLAFAVVLLYRLRRSAV